MKPEELRIGNWYESVKFGLPVKCEASDFMELECRADGAKVDEEHVDAYFRPIKITIRRLKTWGFICKSRNKKFSIWGKGDLTFNSILGWYMDDYKIRQELKYIHQLQNLWFAIYDKEL